MYPSLAYLFEYVHCYSLLNAQEIPLQFLMVTINLRINDHPIHNMLVYAQGAHSQ